MSEPASSSPCSACTLGAESSNSQPEKRVLIDLPPEIILTIVDQIFNAYSDDDLYGYAKPYVELERLTDEELPGNWPQFDVWRDVIRFMSTCRSLYRIVWPSLYKKDVEYNKSSALVLSAIQANPDGVAKSLLRGADVEAPYRGFRRGFHAGDNVVYEEVPHTLRHLNLTTCRTTIWAQGVTAIHCAAFKRDARSLRLIIDAEVDLNRRSTVDIPSTDAVWFPSCRSFTAVAAQFRPSFYRPITGNYTARHLSNGANALYFALANIPHPEFRGPASADSGSYVAAKMLVQSGASLITHLSTRLHALHQACGGRDAETAEFLLRETAGTTADVRDAFGNTPLHHVAMCRKEMSVFENNTLPADPSPTIQILLDHGADIDARNADGLTGLQESLRLVHGHPDPDLLLKLLEKGAAVAPDYEEIIKMFIPKPQYDRLRAAENAVPRKRFLSSGMDSGESVPIMRLQAENWLYKISTMNPWENDEEDYAALEKLPDPLRGADRGQDWSRLEQLACTASTWIFETFDFASSLPTGGTC